MDGFHYVASWKHKSTSGGGGGVMCYDNKHYKEQQSSALKHTHAAQVWRTHVYNMGSSCQTRFHNLSRFLLHREPPGAASTATHWQTSPLATNPRPDADLIVLMLQSSERHRLLWWNVCEENCRQTMGQCRFQSMFCENEDLMHLGVSLD